MNKIELANEIIQQIKVTDPRALWAWGATKFQALPECILSAERTGFGENTGMRGGLRFKVSGLKFKGWVYVWLTGKDLYDLEAISSRGKQKHYSKGYYCDQIMEVIDDLIERDRGYGLKLQKKGSKLCSISV